jgi:hypothetical protein
MSKVFKERDRHTLGTCTTDSSPNFTERVFGREGGRSSGGKREEDKKLRDAPESMSVGRVPTDVEIDNGRGGTSAEREPCWK